MYLAGMGRGTYRIDLVGIFGNTLVSEARHERGNKGVRRWSVRLETAMKCEAMRTS